jgi:hypothetical protein
MRYRRGIAVGALAATAMTIVPIIIAAPAQAVSAPEVIATGLVSPQKLTFGPDGALYVTEAGNGGEPAADKSNCIPAGDSDQPACYGPTGAVTRIDGDAQTRVVSGLPSIGNAEGASGPTDVAVAGDGTIFVLNSLGTNPEDRDAAAQGIPGAANLGAVMKQGPNDSAPSLFADIAAFERDNNPDEADPHGEGESQLDSNPYAMTLASDGTLYVADAGGNDVLTTDSAGDGTVSLFTVLHARQVEFPPGSGQMMPMQAVPTGVELVPADSPLPIPGLPATGEQVLVSQLTGFPFPEGGANIYAPTGDEAQGEDPPTAFEGFTNIIDIAKAPDGSLYVLEIASNSLLSDVPTPALIQIRPDGTRKSILAADVLGFPQGVAVDADGMLYISRASSGDVIKVDPTVASDQNTGSACHPNDVPGAGFTDIIQNVHREAIYCLYWWGIMTGKSDETFDPRATMTRGQLATAIARTMEDAGYQFDANPPDKFSDDEGSVHEANINKLAAAGVLGGYSDGTFRPNTPINRAQVASILVRAWEAVTGANISGGDAFNDDAQSGHEADINAAAEAGWVNGTGEGKYSPAANATRDQLASMIARLLTDFVDNGDATPPAAG